MAKYRIAVEQTRVQSWVVDVEAESEEAAKELVENALEEEHGYFFEDAEGLTVVEDDGPVGTPEELSIEIVDPDFSLYSFISKEEE